MFDKLLILKLNNLIRLKGKKLARKIKRQNRTIGNDRLRARILLVNTANRVKQRAERRKKNDSARTLP
jgi:predicted ATPase